MKPVTVNFCISCLKVDLLARGSTRVPSRIRGSVPPKPPFPDHGCLNCSMRVEKLGGTPSSSPVFGGNPGAIRNWTRMKGFWDYLPDTDEYETLAGEGGAIRPNEIGFPSGAGQKCQEAARILFLGLVDI